MHFFYFLFLFMASLVSAATTTTKSSSSSSSTSTTSTVSPITTLVWVTGTDKDGVTKTTQSAYSQQFTSFYVTIAEPSSGSIYAGSSSVTLGKIKTYSYSTLLNGANGITAGLFVTTILPLFSAFLGLFML